MDIVQDDKGILVGFHFQAYYTPCALLYLGMTALVRVQLRYGNHRVPSSVEVTSGKSKNRN